MPLDRTWYNTLVDDDGSNTVGTPWNKAAVDALMDAVDAALIETLLASTATGAQHNWAPGLSGHTFIKWNGAADLAVTGFAGGVAGQRVTFLNIGTFVATFAHQSASSSAGNKLRNLATSAVTPVAGGGWITYQYDGTDWRLLAHEQGAWIVPAFSAGNFTGVGAMTWTVEAGDVLAFAYRLSGRTLVVTWRISGTSVGGTLNTDLRIGNAAFGGFVPTRGALVPIYVSDNGTASIGIGQVGSGGSLLEINKVPNANWGASTNASSTYGTLTFEVN